MKEDEFKKLFCRLLEESFCESEPDDTILNRILELIYYKSKPKEEENIQ